MNQPAEAISKQCTRRSPRRRCRAASPKFWRIKFGFAQKFIRLNATERFEVAFDLTASDVPTAVQADVMTHQLELRPRLKVTGYDRFPARAGRATLGSAAWGMT